MHGNRANADRLTAAQSGRALELMNQGLVWLADNLRISYGEGALLSLVPHGAAGFANLSATSDGAGGWRDGSADAAFAEVATLVPNNR